MGKLSYKAVDTAGNSKRSTPLQIQVMKAYRSKKTLQTDAHTPYPHGLLEPPYTQAQRAITTN
jgi:hypothetical protein